ncbi:hypothetical protein Tco_0205836 [Tanacetum coccineum]
MLTLCSMLLQVRKARGNHVFCDICGYLHCCLHRPLTRRALLGANDGEVSEGGIPRVIVYGYDGLPIPPVASPSPDHIPGPEDPQTPPVPQDKDEREPMFVQAHDHDFMPEPVYPEYIPLEDEHDPEEFEDDETEDGPVDYPMDEGDNGDDDDDDSSGDDTNDEDEDDEDEEKEEEEEHLAPADSTVVLPTDEPVSPPEGTEPVIPPLSHDISTTGARITVRPQASISLPPEAEVERLLAMTTPSPSPPISLPPPSAGERLARLQIEMRSSLLDYQRSRSDMSLISTGNVRRGTASIDVGYGIRDTWEDSAEAVPAIAPTTLGEVNTRVTELAELHEHDAHDLYAFTKDSQDRRQYTMVERRPILPREAWAHSLGLVKAVQIRSFQTHHDRYSLPRYKQSEIAALERLTEWASEQMFKTRPRDKSHEQEMSDMQAVSFTTTRAARAVQPETRNARIPDHQDASGDADSHI